MADGLCLAMPFDVLELCSDILLGGVDFLRG